MGRGRKKIDKQKRVNYKMKREKDKGLSEKREKQRRGRYGVGLRK